MFRRRTGFKRRRPFGRRRFGFKRRRFNSRRTTGKKTYTTDISHGSFRTLEYRGRRLRQSAWRRALWNNSRFMPHYRALQDTVFTITTPAVQGSGVVTLLFPERSGNVVGGNGFWVAPFTKPIDIGATVPIFDGDITLRGGKFGIHFSMSEASTDVIQIDVFIMFTVPGLPIFADISSPQVLGWDPEVSAGVGTTVGKVLLRRSTILNGFSNSFHFEHKMRVRKIDTDRHSIGSSQFMIVTKVTNLSSANAVAVSAIPYTNLSFSADSGGPGN